MKETLTIDGIHLYYKGNIEQGAVVFLHGGSLNSLVFREQFGGISTFPMLAIDLPGHGASERASEPRAVYNVPAYAELVANIILRLGLRDAILAGHALGANIAIEAADLLPNLRGLFLFSMHPFSQPPRFDLMGRPGPASGYLLSGRLRPAEALLLANEMLSGKPEFSEQLARWILETDMTARLSLTASFGLDWFADEVAILNSFSKPLALLHGRNDRLVSPHYLCGLRPPSLWRSGVIDLDAGHLPQLEMPGRFNALLQDFYRDVWAADGAGEMGRGGRAAAFSGRCKGQGK